MFLYTYLPYSKFSSYPHKYLDEKQFQHNNLRTTFSGKKLFRWPQNDITTDEIYTDQGANKIGRRNASDILGSCVMRFRPGAERC